MKRFVFVAIVAVFLSVPVFGEGLKKRVNNLETRIEEVERRIEMSGTTIPVDEGLRLDSTDPVDLGDLTMVGDETVIDTCDDVGTWSVHSGAGVTVELDTTTFQEGTGSVKITVPAGITAIVHASFAAKDLSGMNYLKWWAKVDPTYSHGINFLFGEDDTPADWQDSGALTVAGFQGWTEIPWNVSAISDANKDAVIRFAVKWTNSWGVPLHIWIDRIKAYSLTELLGFTTEGVVRIIPKIELGTYTGTGADDHVITIARRGTPSAVLTQRVATTPSGMVWRHRDMPAGYSMDVSGGAHLTDGIKSLGDKSFTLGTDTRVNANGYVYYYVAVYADKK